MLGERAHRDKVDPGLGDAPDPLEIHAAGGLELYWPAVTAIGRDGGGHFIEAEFVEHDDVRAGLERLGELAEGLDLHLDRHAISHGARCRDRGGDRAGCGDVVLFHQDAVVEAHPVVPAAAAAHRVFLGEAQARQRLAGVEHGAAGAADGGHVGCRDGGGAGEGLQEVERRALTRQQRARGALQCAERGAAREALAVSRSPMQPDARVDLPEHGLRIGPTGQHGGLARDDLRASQAAGRNKQRGQVAGADVLGQRPRHDLVEVGRRSRCQKGSPCEWPPMHSSIGTDRMKLVREA